MKISEDTPAGRLILNNCNLALISFGLDGLGILLHCCKEVSTCVYL